MDCEEHFFVERESLIENCTNQLIGNPSKGGHYFTIWAPRQTGKTWIIRQCAEIIKSTYKDSFIVADLSMQAFTPSETENIPALLNRYKDYLKRLKDNGENPWANQPRRKTDFHLTEAVGHFHLYFWLKMAID